MGLDDLEYETTRNGGIEGIASALKDRHGRLGSEPVRGGDHAKGANNFRAGCE
jgi:hypothetical protein